MNRRSVLIATAAVSLVALPSAAMAYEAPGVDVTVTDATPALGTSVSLTIDGAEAGESVELTVTSNPASLPNDSITIAGTKSLTKVADASGSVTFVVTFSSNGVFTAAATGAESGLLGDQVLTAGSGVLANTGTGNTAGTTNGAGALAITGSNATTLALGAGVLVAAGGAAVVVARRRKASQS